MEKGLLAVLTILLVLFAGVLAYGLYVVSQPVDSVDTEGVTIQTANDNEALNLIKEQLDRQVEANQKAVEAYNKQLVDLQAKQKNELDEFKKLLEEEKVKQTEVVETTPTSAPTAKFYTDAFIDSDSFNLAECSRHVSRVENFLESDGEYDNAEEDFGDNVDDVVLQKKVIDSLVDQALALINVTNNVYNVTDLVAMDSLLNRIDDEIAQLDDDIDDVAKDLKKEKEIRDLVSFDNIYNLVSREAKNELSDLENDYEDAEDDFKDNKYKSLQDKLGDIKKQSVKVLDELDDAEKDFDDMESEVEDFESRLLEVCEA